MDIETQRLENLRQKSKLLAELNLQTLVGPKQGKTEDAGSGDDFEQTRPKSKKRKRTLPVMPSRVSARIASSGAKPSYRDDHGDKFNYINAKPHAPREGKGNKLKQGKDDGQVSDDLRSLVPVADVDAIRAGWTNWSPVGIVPTRDSDSKFHFDDFPMFQPNKSPEEMIREGAFGGSYFRPLKSKRLGVVVEDDWKELPPTWLKGLDVEKYLTSPVYDADANKFKVPCGQSIEEWEAAGWIAHEYDVRGWYQWYCRFWLGRRCDDDERQVGRWAKCVGPRGRWRRLLLKKYVQLGVRDVADYGDDDDEEGQSKEVSPVMHQTCHHWAFEVRQDDLDAAWQEFG